MAMLLISFGLLLLVLFSTLYLRVLSILYPRFANCQEVFLIFCKFNSFVTIGLGSFPIIYM